MRATDDLDRKKNIYTNGANALPLTLRDLSVNSSVYNKFPLYNVYTYAFYELGITLEHDEEGNFDGNPVEHYADTLVGDLFALNRTRIEADGALVLGVTMAYWGSLSLMLNACERQDDTSIMVSYLDQGKHTLFLVTLHATFDLIHYQILLFSCRSLDRRFTGAIRQLCRIHVVQPGRNRRFKLWPR
jgi:hypothetical protein